MKNKHSMHVTEKTYREVLSLPINPVMIDSVTAKEVRIVNKYEQSSKRQKFITKK